MKFSKFFFALALLCSASVFAANTSIPSFDDEPQLTIKEATKVLQQAAADSDRTDLDFVRVTSITMDDAECTVTVNIDVAGNGGSVSATAATCREALAMVRDLF